jgi:hypothetical protein
MRILIIVPLAKYKWNDEAKENAIGKTYSTIGEEGKCIQDIPWKPRRKVSSRNILEG